MLKRFILRLVKTCFLAGRQGMGLSSSTASVSPVGASSEVTSVSVGETDRQLVNLLAGNQVSQGVSCGDLQVTRVEVSGL